MNELIMEVKPKFCLLQRAIANFDKEFRITIAAQAIVLMFINVIFFAVNKSLILDLIENNQDKFAIYIVISELALIVLIFPLIVLLFSYLDKKNFEVTNYKIYNDRIGFDEGFINHKHTSILFKDIKEIHLDQNFIQRKYNIATIRFVTPSVNLGVKFQDIENAQDVYAKVKEIHDNTNKEV